MAIDAVILAVQDEALHRACRSRALRTVMVQDNLDAAVTSLSVSPAQCVLIADRPELAHDARAAGLVCLALMSGGQTAHELRSAGARATYTNADELVQRWDEAMEIVSPGSAKLTHELMRSLMRNALHAARDGMRDGEAPIGCVLARGDGSIVVTAHNEQNRTQNKTAHAEIVAFARAAGKVELHARDLIMVSTLEPCVMCTGAAMESAVDTIIYGLAAPADAGTQRVACPTSPESQMPRIVGGILADESRALFEEFLCRNPRPEQVNFVRQLLAST